MKKFILITLLVIPFLTVYGQLDSLKIPNRTRFGITAGVNQNYFRIDLDTNDHAINHDTALLFGGVFLETPINNKFSLRTELIYSRISSEDLNLFELPVMLKYQLNDRWYLTGGVQLNYLSDSRDNPAFARDIDQPLTFGLNLGVEYYFTDKLSTYLRYTHRFTNSSVPGVGDINGVKLGVSFRF